MYGNEEMTDNSFARMIIYHQHFIISKHFDYVYRFCRKKKSKLQNCYIFPKKRLQNA